MGNVHRLPPLPPLPRLTADSASRVTRLRALLQEDADTCAACFDAGVPACELSARRSHLVSQVLTHAWQTIVGEVAHMALFAVGGFGHGRLFPGSDVDLLVLGESTPLQAHESGLADFFACLWDIGLRPGQAVRDPQQCHDLASADDVVFTSLLDARCLAGDAALQSTLDGIVAAADMWPPLAYLDARLRRWQHAGHDNVTQNLEPDLKEGPGGLRALDTVRWLGKRLLGASDFNALADAGVMEPAEREQLTAADDTLCQCRYGLHLETGRAEDRLLFDYQRDLARRLGYQDQHARNLDVEQLMQAFYRASTGVERLTVQLGERFRERLEPSPQVYTLNRDFQRAGTRLQLRDPELFRRRPEALLDAFIQCLEDPKVDGFSADTMRRIQKAGAEHGEQLARNENVLAAFLVVLRRGAPAADVLRDMNRFGLLAAIVPGLADVAGRMQYDLYHAYTVDEHILRVIQQLARFAGPSAQPDFALACAVWRRIDRPELLFLAALFHDIAKGRGGDHSVLGEADARSFCQRLGLDADDTALVAWLVRVHLLLSHTAQRRDIDDPAVIREFAASVTDWEHLDYLYLLTVADIVGTSPRLWNAWKARLLADLYVATRYALRADPALPVRTGARVETCCQRARDLLAADGITETQGAAIWKHFPELAFLRHRPEQIAWQTRAIAAAEGGMPVVAVQRQSVRGTTELFVHAPNRDGLFVDIAATLDRQGMQVVEAHVLASDTGMALNTFLLLDAQTLEPATVEQVASLQEAVSRSVHAVLPQRPPQRRLSRRVRHFLMHPQIRFDRDTQRQLTQLALVCTDQPGLLAAATQVLADAGVRVHDARIATFGQRVENFFLLSDGANAALSAAGCAHLEQALEQGLAPEGVDTPGNG